MDPLNHDYIVLLSNNPLRFYFRPESITYSAQALGNLKEPLLFTLEKAKPTQPYNQISEGFLSPE